MSIFTIKDLSDRALRIAEFHDQANQAEHVTDPTRRPKTHAVLVDEMRKTASEMTARLITELAAACDRPDLARFLAQKTIRFYVEQLDSDRHHGRLPSPDRSMKPTDDPATENGRGLALP